MHFQSFRDIRLYQLRCVLRYVDPEIYYIIGENRQTHLVSAELKICIVHLWGGGSSGYEIHP